MGPPTQMDRRVVVNWSIAIALEAAFIATYYYSPREQPLAYLLVFSLLPVLYLLAAFKLHQDGFSLGSLVVALAFEVAIYVGWSHSPQLEEPRLLWTASAMPLIFVVIVFLFNYLQREA